MAGNPAAMDELRNILMSREALYARAEAQIDTSGRGLPETLDAVLDLIEKRGFLRA
jgi:XRE family transcriptional regulator, aerobic/anaerobic benzoate catabolism transcriptional regulator